MKKLIFFGASVISSFMANGQTSTFSNVALENKHNREVLSFVISPEQNVRYYRIEAGDDSATLAVIATMPSRGNTMLGACYNYDVTAFHYAYYRVGKVEMDGRIPHSAVVYKQENPQPENLQNQDLRAVATGCKVAAKGK